MKYKNIFQGKFISRPNRFIANVEIDGVVHVCHVKNTGRCKELLTENAVVYLEKSDNPNRKTQFDLVCVVKNHRLINMDSYAPNIAVGEYLRKLYPNGMVKSECKYGKSRLDFYVEDGDRKIFIEVKGVTLEDENIARFPDAPTERGIKHLLELAQAVTEGYEAMAFFVVQMNNIVHFTPNDITHQAFGDTLRKVSKEGVKIFAFECNITTDSMEITKEVPVVL